MSNRHGRKFSICKASFFVQLNLAAAFAIAEVAGSSIGTEAGSYIAKLDVQLHRLHLQLPVTSCSFALATSFCSCRGDSVSFWHVLYSHSGQIVICFAGSKETMATFCAGKSGRRRSIVSAAEIGHIILPVLSCCVDMQLVSEVLLFLSTYCNCFQICWLLFQIEAQSFSQLCVLNLL